MKVIVFRFLFEISFKNVNKSVHENVIEGSTNNYSNSFTCVYYKL